MTGYPQLLLFAVLLPAVLGSPAPGLSHSCSYEHPQTKFCQADFVVRAKAVKEIWARFDNSTGVYELKYKFRVGEVYKSPSVHPWPKRQIIKAHAFDVFLQVGQTYVISGRKRRKSLVIDKCDFVQPFDQISRMQDRGLRGRYEMNCACAVYDDCLTAEGNYKCSGDELLASKAKQEDDTSCGVGEFAGDPDTADCYNKHAGCYVRSNFRGCKWKEDEEYFAFCVNKKWLLH